MVAQPAAEMAAVRSSGGGGWSGRRRRRSVLDAERRTVGDRWRDATGRWDMGLRRDVLRPDLGHGPFCTGAIVHGHNRRT